MSTKSKITLCALILPLVTALYGIFTKQSSIFFNSLLTASCILGFMLVDKKLNMFNIRTYTITLIFILLCIFAGRSLGFYKRIPYWDKSLHFISGFVIVMIAYRIFEKLNGDLKNKLLKKTFCFFVGVTGAAFWEIFEFSCDKIIGTTAQNNSLTDTMLDIILGTLGALIAIFL